MTDSSSTGTYRGRRCGLCYWALYDGDWCQNTGCVNHGKSVAGENIIYLANDEAAILIAVTTNDGFALKSV